MRLHTLLALFLLPAALWAQIRPEVFSKLTNGTSITSYATPLDTVADGRYASELSVPSFNWRALYKHGKVTDRILIRVKEPATSTPAFDYDFLLKVDAYSVNGTHTTFNTTVRVSYNPAQFKQLRDMGVYEFRNAHKFVCRILSVTDHNTAVSIAVGSLKKNFSIEEEIRVERYYKSNYDTGIDSAKIKHAFLPNGKIMIDWRQDTASAATPVQYELEWQHVDNIAGGYNEFLRDYTRCGQNYDDSTGTLGWYPNAGTTWGISGGNFYFNTPAGYDGSMNNPGCSTVIGRHYRLEADVSFMTMPGKLFKLIAFNPSLIMSSISVAGKCTLDFIAAQTVTPIAYVGTQGGTYRVNEMRLIDVTNEPAPGQPYYKPLELLTFNFANNATRVRTSQLSYTIENVFEHGWVLYRVRRVRPDSVYFKYEKFTAWSPAQAYSGLVQNYGKKLEVSSHLHDSINWNYQVSYMEDGKRKDAVGYYDGLLKPRQNVVISNTDTMVIVGENKYDFQGRPTVQILPVPALKPFATGSDYYQKELTYYRNFNRSSLGSSYSASQFDSLASVCPADTSRSLSQQSGAAKYYSWSNPDKNEAQKYVPDAEGYPMTQVEYMPDNTGRVRRQGGVGWQHQLGRGKETKYMYEQPMAPEIERVFGSEAGFAAHYKKQSVKDANGQVSVQYLDMAGHTVATALAGGAPANLDALPENRPASIMFTKLNSFNLEQSSGIELSYPINLLQTGPVYIDYRLQTSLFRDNCLPLNFCFKCVYTYEVSLVNTECDQLVFAWKDTIGFLNPADTVCGVLSNYKLSGKRYQLHSLYSQVDTVNLDSMIRVLGLPAGQYQLHKRLYVNPGAYNLFFNVYQQKHSCAKTFSDFFNEALSKTDFSGCKGCDTCDTLDYCGSMLSIMKSDVSPGGQYFAYDLDTSGNVVIGTDPTNVLVGAKYKLIKTYRTADGVVSKVPMVSGVMDSAYKADLNTFVRYFHVDWADSLVRLHPEYCYYRYCKDTLTASYKYDFKFAALDDYDSAYLKGYLNPTQLPGLKFGFPLSSVGQDPLFASRPALRNRMNNLLTNFKVYKGRTYSAWDVAALEAFCGPLTSDAEEIYACLEAFANPRVRDSIFFSKQNRDQYLAAFQAMYTSVKSKILDSLMQQAPARYSGMGYFCPTCTYNVWTCAGYSGKQRRFTFAFKDQYPGANDSLIGVAMEADATARLASDSMCKVTAMQWAEALNNCPYMTPGLKDSISINLAVLCERGRLSMKPPSVFPVAEVPLSDTLARFHNTDEVLHYFLGDYYTDRLCNSSLFRMAYKSDHRFFSSDSAACKCTSTGRVTPPPVVLHDSVNTTYVKTCLKDTIDLTQLGKGLQLFFNELTQPDHRELGNFIDTATQAYHAYFKNPGVLPMEHYRGEIFRKHYPAFPNKDIYQWRMNFLDDTIPTHRCNVFIDLTDQIKFIIFNLQGSYGKLRPDPKGFAINFYYQDPFTHHKDSVVLRGTTSCGNLFNIYCTKYTTDTIYGKPAEVDSSALDSFIVRARLMRSGNADTLLAKYIGGGLCNMPVGFFLHAGGGSCANPTSDKTKLLVKSLSEALYSGRIDTTFDFTVMKDTINPTWDNSECYNLFMDNASPTFAENFSLEWARFDGYRGFEFAPNNDHIRTCYDDQNVFGDPYFIGGGWFGIDQCDPKPLIKNCTITFGSPYDPYLQFGSIDSFYDDLAYDPKLGWPTVTARAGGRLYKLTVKSCKDEPMTCTELYSHNTDLATYSRGYVTRDKRPRKYTITCPEINRQHEENHDRTCEDEPFLTTPDYCAFTPSYMQYILHTFADASVLTSPTFVPFDTSCMAYSFRNVMDTFEYRADIVRDSLLIGYIGDHSALNGGCQLSLRLLGGSSNFSFADIDKFTRIRPDEEKLNEYMDKGEFEKGKHFFIITATDIDSGRSYTLRGWLSCVPVYDCIAVDTMGADTLKVDSRCACATCPEIRHAVDSFRTKYPSLAYNDAMYKTMFTNFLNDQMNNNLAFNEYEDFMKGCGIFNMETFSKSECDYRITGQFSAACLARIDTIVQQVKDSFGYTVNYRKWNVTDNDYDLCFDLSSISADLRPAFTNRLYNAINGATECTLGFVVSSQDFAYKSPCSVYIDLYDPSFTTTSCGASLGTVFNANIGARYGVYLPPPQLYYDYSENSPEPGTPLYRYCIDLSAKDAGTQADIYHIIDSLYQYCTYLKYGSNFVTKGTAGAFQNKTLCLSQYDTAYIKITGTTCLTCRGIQEKIDAYQDYIYKYRRDFIREATLPENIEVNLYNRFGLVAQVYDMPACAGCSNTNMMVCTPSQEAYDFTRLLQHLKTTGDLYNSYIWLTYDTFFVNSSLNVGGNPYPNVYYNPQLEVIRDDSAVLHATVVLDGQPCTLNIFGDTSLNHIDTIFGSRSIPGTNGHSMLIELGTNGQRKALTAYSDCYDMSSCCSYPKPVLCFRSMLETPPLDTNSCRSALTELARANASSAYQQYSDSLRFAFKQQYQRACLDSAWAKEKAGAGKEFAEYHFTLYYYDVSGNLVKTVPPAGVDTLNVTAALSDQLEANRKNYQTSSHVFTHHKMATTYRYNSLGQVTWQNTPDADSTKFYYDVLGRLAVSQNARQMAQGYVYSYTVMDAMNRITEVGEVTNVALNADSLKFQYGAYFNNWLKRGVKRQITRTTYDTTWAAAVNVLFPGGQQNLRSRVSTVAYYETDVATYLYATHYSYDIHGNVNVLIQDYPELAAFNNRYKRIYYDYDLLSGKVNLVSYQPAQPDRFYHRYEYDADNRLVQVYTSTDSVIWDNDAAYTYYKHGPLARTELGDYKVQGVDYAYTIHGWLKGINSNTLDSSRDMGNDGHYTHALDFPTDVFGFTLGYYTGDYKPIDVTYYNTATAFAANITGSPLAQANNDLFNGNISHMVTAVKPLLTSGKPLASIYRYDQLNRIKRMETYTNVNLSTNAWNSGSTGSDYLNTFTYDQNGNILKLYRNGLSTAPFPQMDSMTYNYVAGTNKLNWVRDGVAAGNYPDDIDNQSANNYGYDKTGNLVEDRAEQIDTILWNVYGKVRQIKRDNGSTKPGMEFRYDASGQRNVKIVKRSSKENDWDYTYYVRDAQGNVMATYNKRSFLQTDMENYAAVTSWIYAHKGLAALQDFVYNKFVLGNPNGSYFMNLYINTLVAHGLQMAVMENYTLDNYLQWNPGLSAIIVSAIPPDQQIDFIHQLLLYNKTELITAMVNCNEIKFLTLLFADLDVQEEFWQYLCDKGYEVVLKNLCDNLGIAPPAVYDPGTGMWIYPTCRDYMDALEGFGDKEKIAIELSHLIDTKLVIETIDRSVSVDQVETALDHMAFEDIIPALTSCYDKYLLTDFFLHTYDNPTLALDILLAHTDPFILLHILADHYPDSFTRYAVGVDFNLLNEVLVQLNYFDINQYLELVRQQWGQSAYDSVLSTMVFTQQLRLAEHHLYGSSRLGIRYADTTLLMRDITITGFDSTGAYQVGSVVSSTTLGVDTTAFFRLLAKKHYELSDHLGNVLATVYDRRTPIGSTTITGYKADVTSAQYYYPFGQMMKRYYGDTTYRGRFKFNGKEKDDETYGDGNEYDFGARIYDPRLGKWMSVDPKTAILPGWSPYNYTFDNPLIYTDPDGQLPNPINLIADLFRDFRPQTTKSFLTEAYKKNFFTTGGTIQRLGRIYEDAVIRSLGEDKNTRSFKPAITSPKAVIPDLVSNSGVTYFDPLQPSERHHIEFVDASFVDAKFKSGIKFVDDNNPYQLRDMIDVLSNMKGGTVDGKWNPTIKASDYGAASLTLITPFGTTIDPELIKYATEKNVVLYQRYTEQDENDGDRIRVGSLAKPLNFVSTERGFTWLFKAAGQSVEADWEKR